MPATALGAAEAEPAEAEGEPTKGSSSILVLLVCLGSTCSSVRRLGYLPLLCWSESCCAMLLSGSCHRQAENEPRAGRP